MRALARAPVEALASGPETPAELEECARTLLARGAVREARSLVFEVLAYWALGRRWRLLEDAFRRLGEVPDADTLAETCAGVAAGIERRLHGAADWTRGGRGR